MSELEFKRKVFSLAERLFPMVARLLGNRTSAEDAIQEIMLKLWEKRHQIGQHANITGFVFLTARNYCIDVLRKRKLKIDHAPTQLQQLKSAHGQEQSEWRDLNGIVKKILEELPEQQRAILMMRDLDGYEFVEIAAATQLKVEHVRVLLSRARKQVSLRLAKMYDYEKR
ncbi:MAG: RNA polymerase sigma factor [Bacteroidota bacterium]